MLKQLTYFTAILLLTVFSGCHPPSETKLPSHAALDTSETITTIAFGSCNKENMPQPLWRYIMENKPDLWIWMGDNIYADTQDMELMDSLYGIQKQHPDYARLVSTVPVIGTWDDHDYGINDGGKYFSKKEESENLLLDFLHIPDTNPVRNREGVYQSYTFGPKDRQVKIILLDTRYFRDTLIAAKEEGKLYEPNFEGDILGEAQWQWLEHELNSSEAALNIIGSSIQVIAEEHGYEKWANFPSARRKLFDLIASSGAQRTIFISGDRHIAEVAKYEESALEYPLYDFTSSGLTHTWAHARGEKNPYRISDLIVALNFGIIDIDWGSDPIEVTFKIKGEDNKVFWSEKIQY